MKEHSEKNWRNASVFATGTAEAKSSCRIDAGLRKRHHGGPALASRPRVAALLDGPRGWLFPAAGMIVAQSVCFLPYSF